MKRLITGLLALWAGAAAAQNSTPGYDALVLEGLTAAAGERKAFVASFGSYTDDPSALDVGQFAMRNDKGRRITLQVELIGTYDDATRTFTWGWATDQFPSLPRTAVDAVRAHGLAADLPELTTSRSIGGAVDAGVRANLATILGDLDLVVPTDVGTLTVYLGLPNLEGAAS